MSLPIILCSGEGESVRIGGSVCTFKATGKDTRGQAGIFEFTMPPGAGASPHIHKKLTEMFYVTEGNVELLLADKRSMLLKVHLCSCRKAHLTDSPISEITKPRC